MKLTPEQEAIANVLANEFTTENPVATDANYNDMRADYERRISDAISRALEMPIPDDSVYSALCKERNELRDKLNAQSEDAARRILKCYEPIEGEEAIKNADGAQMYDGKWWMPIWGCDTLQYIMEALE